MKLNGQDFNTIWVDAEGDVIVIDQTKLPFDLQFKTLRSLNDAYHAIADMTVRGAPLIGVTAAYGVYLALKYGNRAESVQQQIQEAVQHLNKARPTAVNLMFATARMASKLEGITNLDEACSVAFEEAASFKIEEIAASEAIGEYGANIIEEISKKKSGETVNILTHCNAGWLACIDWGSALAPIYKAQVRGIDLHVWVDETRPRMQGSKLTAYELGQQGVAHTVISDNSGGHLMQHGFVDVVIVGSDRTTRNGDVCNKIGTYLKALAAADNSIPFYAALPVSTIDFSLTDGIQQIPIEERNGDELRYVEGFVDGVIKRVAITPQTSSVANHGFDVTPARLVTAIITEQGVFTPDELEKIAPE